MRRQHHQVEADQRIAGRRLGLEDIECRAGDMAGRRASARALSTRRPPRAQLMIDAALHAGYGGGIDDVAGLVGQGVCSDTKSARRSSSSKGTFSTPSSIARSATGKDRRR